MSAERRDAPAPAPRRGPHLVGRSGYPMLLLALAVSLMAAIAAAIGIGTVSVSPGRVADVVWSNLTRSADDVDPLIQQIVWEFRTPRVLVADVVGAGLSVAGVCLQALVRNPLADPYVLGVSSGAALGAVMVLTSSAAVLDQLGVAGGAFIGSSISLALVFMLAQRSGQLDATRLVLAGVAIAYLGNAATSFVQLRSNPTELRGIMFWLLGSVSGATWDDLTVPAVTIVVAMAWLMTQGRNLNALTVGDDTAAGLGVDVHRLRILLLVVSSLLTATVVSVAGGIGFVGLMVPHAVRLVVGPDHRRVLPVALLGGAAFLVLVDLASRVIDRPNEMPIGIFTAAMGAPFFLILLRRRSGVGH